MKLFNKYWGLLLIVLISFLPLLPLMHSGLPLTHDGQDHVARIANFYQSLTEGNIIPRWAGNLNWGYGHPILMFLYPLSSYTASLFHLFGFSFIDSTKLVFAVAFILSGAAMYLWLRELLGEKAAVVGAIIYNFAPYRFVDLYVRGAIGEHMAFIFPPLILFFLTRVARSNSFDRISFSLGALSIAGLILAHNAISIMFLPFICFYAVYLIWNTTNHKSLAYQFIAIFILGLMLSSFFLLPAFLEGKYTLRDIVTQGITLTRFVDISSLAYGSWNFGQSGEFSVQIGVIQWIAIVASVLTFFLFKPEKHLKVLIGFTFMYFVMSIFLMLPISLFLWESISTLQKFQFPWRFLSVSVFASAVLGACAINAIKSTRLQTISVVVFVIGSLLLTQNYWTPKGYLEKPDSFYSGIYHGTTDTGESAPIWSVRFMEHTASTSAEVIAGTASIKKTFRNSTLHSYEIDAEFRTRIRENTLYFPGWRIYIDGKQYQGIQFQDPENRGLITYYVSSGKHKVDIKFGDTRLRTIANYLSFAALLIILGTMLGTFDRFKTKNK